MIIRLISLLVRGIISASTETKPVLEYNPGIENLDKAFFDADYYFPYFRVPLGDMPRDIDYYAKLIAGRLMLAKQRDTKEFEIYETHIISDKELVMNVRMSYGDFVMTGISSHKNSVVTRNEFFVLIINEVNNRLEVKSSMHADSTDKAIKGDFGDYLILWLKGKYQGGLQAPAGDLGTAAPQL